MACTTRHRPDEAPCSDPSREASDGTALRGFSLGFSWVPMAAAAILIATRTDAQTLNQDFLKPRLVLNGQGHSASLRAMTFSPDGNYLFSAGLDKVVHVWAFHAGRPRLERTIRPPILRKGGWIYTLALSPVADAQQQRQLAIAGYGVSAPAGDILIYRLPGLRNPGTGDLTIYLPSDSRTKPINQRLGHADAVLSLAFSPDGHYLASGGKDKTIRIWDILDANHPTVAVLTGHSGEVAHVSFLNREQLISGGGEGDGTLRTWNWKLPQPLLASLGPTEEDLKSPIGVWIKAMTLNPDGRSVALGRENGKIEVYDPPALTHGNLLNPDAVNMMRPVEAIALSPDGKSLAASILKYSPGPDRAFCAARSAKSP